MPKSIYVIIAVIILIIVIVAIVATRQRTSSVSEESTSQTTSTDATSPTPETSETSSATHTITYSDSGFSPNTLTINAGDAVTFVNQSSGDMWVASNPHPIHISYRGFDADRGYAPGTSYSFTFTRSGNWGFHNHLNPNRGGTITVK